MKARPTIETKSVVEARKTLTSILDAAVRGQTTLIAQRGKVLAAVVPAKDAAVRKPASLLALAGSGEGLWGRDSSGAVSRMRDHWSG